MDIPVPRTAYLGLNTEDVGFELMIMDHVGGNALHEKWSQMPWLKKELLVRKMINYMIQLFRPRFHRLGSLYHTSDLQTLHATDIPEMVPLGEDLGSSARDFCLSQIVAIPFFVSDKSKVNVSRGLFMSSRDWLEARLRLHLDEVEKMADRDESDSDDEDESDAYQLLNSAEAYRVRAQRLLDILPSLFPDYEREEFVLVHLDLHSGNIMVDLDHSISGVIDWECISTCPLWLACTIPKFLFGPYRAECPDLDKFSMVIRDDGTEDRNPLYYEQLEEYKSTQLHHFFLEGMERVCPEWMQIFENDKLKVAFEEVVSNWRFEIMTGAVEAWLDACDRGDTLPPL